MIYEAVDALGGALAPIGWFLETGLVHGTALAAITALLTFTVLRRARPALIAALWTIVLIKFVLPVGPRVPVSVSGLVDSAMAGDSVAPQTTQAYVASRIAESSRVLVGVSTTQALTRGAQAALLCLYLVAVIWIFRRRWRAQWQLRARIGAMDRAPPAVRAEIAKLAARVGARRVPAIRMSPDPIPPHLVGLMRPVLVLPAGGELSWSDAEREAALIHELAHLRRGDTWLRGLQLAVGTLFFFLPVIGWVNRRLDCAREMACDQWALAHGALDRRDYARMLVAWVSRHRATPGAALGLTAAPAQLEARVEALLRRHPRPRIGAVSGAALVAWAVVSLGVGERAHAVATSHRRTCGVVDQQLKAQILHSYPEADADGDGRLSQEEICDHQLRMERLLAGRVATSMASGSAAVSWLDPLLDRDGDGVPDSDRVAELVHLSVKSGRVTLDPVEFPGRICTPDDGVHAGKLACSKESHE